MLVNDFLDTVGDYLQEDYTTSPIWTKAELLNVVRQVYRQFCTVTGLVDKTEIRLINGTTGEMDLPKDFESAYFVQHEQNNVDIAELDELDFVSGTWLAGTSGTPKAATVFGSGDNAVVRFVPVPSSVWAGGSANTLTKTGLILQHSLATSRYTVTVASGVLVTTAVGSGTVHYPTIAGPSTVWELRVTSDGILYTTATSGGAAYYGLLDTDTNNTYWELSCSDSGELVTTPEYLGYGLTTSALIDNAIYQDFSADGSGSSAEYGVVVDTYAQASSTSPSYTSRANSARGLALYAYTSDEAGMVWYKGSLPELGGLYSELRLSAGFIPVLLHGVLSMAFSMRGDGHDPQKAELLGQVFISECEAIRRGFEYRWA